MKKKGNLLGLYNIVNEERDLLREMGPGEEDATVIDMVDDIIKKGYLEGASDIHFEPQENRLRVRFRVDGILEEGPFLPHKLIAPMISRIKIMANLDIGEKRLPQDGHIFQMSESGSGFHIRVSTIPTSQGEKVALRLLPQEKEICSLRDLGFTSSSLSILDSLIHVPNGMILITGPTGCGKTTTLYAILKALNTPTRNIISIEDPIECEMSGVNQISVNLAAGLDFIRGLRAILRQDPDVIMIGEIRDAETASIAVRAAIAGCLVLSSLHTRDAIGAITRLLDMGIPRYKVEASLVGVVAQRLVARLCPYCCIETDDLSAGLLNDLGNLPFLEEGHFYQQKGCSKCQGKGYKGRVLLHEIFTVNQEIKQLIHRGASEHELRSRAQKQGMETLWEAGLQKARQGETTLAELERVIWEEKSRMN